VCAGIYFARWAGRYVRFTMTCLIWV
jgi:hypothetical protein